MKKESATGKIVSLLPNSLTQGNQSLEFVRTQKLFQKKRVVAVGRGLMLERGMYQFLTAGVDTGQKYLRREAGGRVYFDSWFEGIQLFMAERQGYESMMAEAYAGLVTSWSPKSRETGAGIRAGL